MIRFINNFKAVLTQPFGVNDMGMTMSNDDGVLLDNAIGNGTGTGNLIFLTLDDGNNIEIVAMLEYGYLADGTGAYITVARYIDGTAAQDWPTGTVVEARMTGIAARALAVQGAALAMAAMDANATDGSGNKVITEVVTTIADGDTEVTFPGFSVVPRP